MPKITQWVIDTYSEMIEKRKRSEDEIISQIGEENWFLVTPYMNIRIDSIDSVSYSEYAPHITITFSNWKEKYIDLWERVYNHISSIILNKKQWNAPTAT